MSQAIPWLTIWTIDFLEDYLKSDMRVFEYGGGGSTIFFAKRVEQLVTIEHDREWYNMLINYMEKHKIVNCNIHYMPAENTVTDGLNPSDPEHYFSGDPRFVQNVFNAYASSIDKFPDNYFDLILIDGRARPSCMKHGITKVKRNGLLILDNADRPHYQAILRTVPGNFRLVSDHFGPTPNAPLFTQTNIWQRLE